MTVVLQRPEAAVTAPTWRERIVLPATGGGGWLATLLIGLLAGLLRFLRLDIPRGKIFDEIYYACDAQNLLRYGVEHDTVADNPGCVPKGGGGFIVHPPLGKWAIAVGEKLFGVNEFGWRFSAAVFGTLTVVVLVRLTRRMTGSTLLGCLAGLLLSLDGLHFVQSRTAMLDVFLAFWTTAAFACLVADRDWVRRRLAATDDGALSGWGPRFGLRRPWLLGTGACLGAAVATKWSGLFYLAVLGLLAFAWEVGARRTAGVRGPVRAVLVRSAVPLLVGLVVLPAALYVLSWFGWFHSDIGYDRQWADTHPASGVGHLLPDALRSWWQYHREIFGFHDNLSSKHPYQSHPIGWLFLARPVSYYYPQGIGPGQYGCTVMSCSREVLAIGTPAIWWASIFALIGCTWLWASRRDWRAGSAVVLVAAGIVPWVRDDLHHRTMFLFYALPSVPFMCLALALCAGWALGPLGTSRRRRVTAATAVGGYVALVVVNFAYFYPVLAAVTLPYASWYARMWFPTAWI